jgi:hypothetical protein
MSYRTFSSLIYKTMALLPILAGAAEKQWEWKLPERQVTWDNVQRIGSDHTGRPQFILPFGKPIRELI